MLKQKRNISIVVTVILIAFNVVVNSSPTPFPASANKNNHNHNVNNNNNKNAYNDNSYWCKENLNAIKNRVKLFNVSPEDLVKVKNVIMFVGDGVGTTTLTAARLFKEQRMNMVGGTGRLIWDEFPTLAHVKTHTANTQIGESSACATALFSGVKTNFEAVGVDDSVAFNVCNKNFSNSKVSSIISWAQAYGMRTGFVTTTRVTHATPAALYAHSPSRYWEDDTKMPEYAKLHCKDIARQLVEDVPGRKLNVIMGGGRRHWLTNHTLSGDTSHRNGHYSARRLDGRNLISEWTSMARKHPKGAEYVTNKAQLLNVSDKTEYLLGLFADSHMSFNMDRDVSDAGEPSLAEMVTAALKVLQKGNERYFLMVEAGRIDHAHHHNNAYRALDDTLALDDAVSIALNSSLINLKDTLVLVTSDHSDSLTFSGYGTPRGSSVFGVESVSEVDSTPYTLLTYASGPGYKTKQISEMPENIIQRAAIPQNWGNHGGEDVPLYAVGPLANILFTGTVDQTYIAHAIAFALCISEHADRCYKFYNFFNKQQVSLKDASVDADNEGIDGSANTPDDDMSDELLNYDYLEKLTRFLRSDVPRSYHKMRTTYSILFSLSLCVLVANRFSIG